MQSKYRRLGNYIQEVNVRNTELKVDRLLGVSIQKELMPSIANTIGTNMKTYKILKRNQFAYGPVTSRNGDKISIALLEDFDEVIVSQAYTAFEITDISELLPEYLMMWFRRPEFDRYARYMSHGSAREVFGWEELCNTYLPVHSPEKQHEIVTEYRAIRNRIELNNKLIQKLEVTAQEIFGNCFVDGGKKALTRLGDLLEIRGGFSYHSKDLSKGNSYLLGMGCISFTNRFIEEGMRLYSDDFPDKHLVFPRDIVIATRQQSENMPILGYPAMIPPELEGENLIAASNLYRVVNNSDLSNEVIYQLLRSPGYLEHIRLNTKGTTVGMITKDAIEDFYFGLPSKDTISRLQFDLERIVDYIFLKRREIKRLNELKDLVLSKLATVEN